LQDSLGRHEHANAGSDAVAHHTGVAHDVVRAGCSGIGRSNQDVAALRDTVPGESPGSEGARRDCRRDAVAVGARPLAENMNRLRIDPAVAIDDVGDERLARQGEHGAKRIDRRRFGGRSSGLPCRAGDFQLAVHARRVDDRHWPPRDSVARRTLGPNDHTVRRWILV
jgi:hypothetical protein